MRSWIPLREVFRRDPNPRANLLLGVIGLLIGTGIGVLIVATGAWSNVVVMVIWLGGMGCSLWFLFGGLRRGQTQRTHDGEPPWWGGKL